MVSTLVPEQILPIYPDLDILRPWAWSLIWVISCMFLLITGAQVKRLFSFEFLHLSDSWNEYGKKLKIGISYQASKKIQVHVRTCTGPRNTPSENTPITDKAIH